MFHQIIMRLVRTDSQRRFQDLHRCLLTTFIKIFRSWNRYTYFYRMNIKSFKSLLLAIFLPSLFCLFFQYICHPVWILIFIIFTMMYELAMYDGWGRKVLSGNKFSEESISTLKGSHSLLVSISRGKQLPRKSDFISKREGNWTLASVIWCWKALGRSFKLPSRREFD